MDLVMDLIIMILHKLASCEHSFHNITIVIFQYQRNFPGKMDSQNYGPHLWTVLWTTMD